MSSLQIVAWIIGVLPALIAIVALIVDRRQNRRALQAQLLLNLNQQWASEEVKVLRRRVAQNLLNHRRPNYELGELLDLISVICYLYRGGAFSTDCLGTQFGWWIIRYWLCAKEWVTEIRSVDSQGWTTVELVAGELMHREEKEGFPAPSEQELSYFLKVESGLFIKHPHSSVLPRRVSAHALVAEAPLQREGC